MRFLVCLILCIPTVSLAYRLDLKPLPRQLAAGESFVAQEQEPGPAPEGPVHALGEWESADSAMTLWPNPSLIREIGLRGKVTILADSAIEESAWRDWLLKQSIGQKSVDFFQVETDTIWVRDYGPIFIIDGDNQMGVVDTVYNRPRPLDDRVPFHIGRKLNLPVYRSGLVHTGGNFYSDGLGNAFSSTLVYSENPLLSVLAIGHRLTQFFGVVRYATARLAPQITIEHIDTFGKLVAPDTWVIGQFPPNAPYYEDSENFVKKIQQLRSPYGGRYKIYRLPIPDAKGNKYRAYVNSFIHNNNLFFASYGDRHDEMARGIYEKALPGYNIVSVDALNTFWGDSVHCRTRNIHSRDTAFIFPTVFREKDEIVVQAEVIASPGAQLVGVPKIHMSFEKDHRKSFGMTEKLGKYEWRIPHVGEKKLSFYIEAEDSRGIVKRAPIMAPQMNIEVNTSEL